MNILTFALSVGVGCAVIVIACLALYERKRRSVGDLHMSRMSGQHYVAQIGMTADAPMSLATVIMRPTLGLRLWSIGMSLLALWLVWGPVAATNAHNTLLAVGVSLLIGYAVCYIAMYEARYDDEGITLPHWLGTARRYDWQDFHWISRETNLLYRLHFSCKRTARMQKYLVGMPTFLTFIADVERLNRKI